jgi:hypothetical protein
MTGLAQSQLVAVLRYFAHGDFARFSRAAELVLGAARVKEPYFCADLLFAFQIAGLCEVSSASGITQWWASHRENVRINSMCPKEVGATSCWFSEHEERSVGLITDAGELPLVLGSFRDSDVSRAGSVFNRRFVDLVPRFPDIEHQVSVEVPITDQASRKVEAFDPDTGRWNEATLDELVGSCLIRIWKQYSGVAFYVNHSTLGLRFRITQPEWAFVAAYQSLPWRLSSILRVDGQRVTVRRAVRLPTVLYRSLFASCQLARIGPVVTFEGVDVRCIGGILSYFKAVGERL